MKTSKFLSNIFAELYCAIYLFLSSKNFALDVYALGWQRWVLWSGGFGSLASLGSIAFLESRSHVISAAMSFYIFLHDLCTQASEICLLGVGLSCRGARSLVLGTSTRLRRERTHL